MRELHRSGDGESDLRRAPRASGGGHEPPAVDALHREIGDPFVLAYLVHRHDVVVVQGRHELRLAHEVIGGIEVGGEDLERYGVTEAARRGAGIHGFVHHADAALPEDAPDLVGANLRPGEIRRLRADHRRADQARCARSVGVDLGPATGAILESAHPSPRSAARSERSSRSTSSGRSTVAPTSARTSSK